MMLSGEECLRVSHLLSGRPVSRSVSLSSIATAPARGIPAGVEMAARRRESSVESKEVQDVVQKISGEPEVREDVVAQLRERIENGTYFVTGEQIGEMMLRRFIADHNL